MGRKGSEVSPSKRYPLRSTHSSGRVLRSATNTSITACSEPPNSYVLAQPAVTKRKRGSLSGSSNNSVRVLRSASKNKVDPCSEGLDDSIPGTPDTNKRNGARPSKAASPINSVTLLRSASKNKDGACNETLNSSSTTGEQTAYGRKCVTPSKVGSSNNSLRVLLCASKSKNDTYSEPLNDNTLVQPSVKKRKTGSPLKVGSPASSARVLRSNSKMTSKTFNMPLNDNTSSQPVSRKRKSDTAPKAGSLKVGVRVLRSASRKKDACVEPLNVSTPVQPAAKKRISGRSSKERSPKKDYFKICQRVKYILNRMNYEQSFIQAYSSEGWKGQSSEKIRPEKELERAAAEILRCKIKIREAFRNMDSLLSEGKLEESLFDSAGEIFSEDIFCAICGSKDVTLKNDIILCDGACDRGFHQNCLNPPLRTEDIPAGDEGWFCPACVCKIDCIDALNELQGSKLSVHDPWEKVFPEAASLANGSKERDASDLPLGDSEYTDDKIAMIQGHMVKEGRSSAEDEVDDLGLPSDDSEDDDFDPTGPDSSEDQKNESHSEESDFTSDSDDFCVEIAKFCGQGEVSMSQLSDVNEKTIKETELDQDVVLPVSSRRQVERLDYKKLYDEAYGEESSSSSDEEEWSGNENLEDSDTDGSVRPAKVRSRRTSAGYPNSQCTPQSKRSYGSVSGQHSSNGAARRFDPIIKQKLQSHFEKDRYPSRATKESLAQELGLTFIQVGKWFESTRHSLRVAAATKGKQTENYNTGNNDGTVRNSNEKNDRTSVDSIPGKESNNRAIESPTKDRNDTVSPKLMLQINLNEGNDDDFMFSQHPSCKETVVTTPTAISRAVGPTGYMPGENQGSGDLWSTVFEQGLVTTPTTVSREVGPPGYAPGENQGYGESCNTMSEQRIFMNLAISQEVGPPGFGPGENQGNNASWNTSSEQRFYIPTISSSEACPPGYGPGGGQVNGTSRDTSSEKRVDTASTISMQQVGPPGYGPSEYQVSGTSWGTSNEQRGVMTPSTNPIDVGPPGFWPGGNQGNSGASWNNSCEENVFMTPTTTLSGPPGFYPRENKGNGASTNARSPNGGSAQKPEHADEARKKAIARELRRMKKFR